MISRTFSLFIFLMILLVGCSEATSSELSTPVPEPTVALPPEVVDAIETLQPVLTAAPESGAVGEESSEVIQTRAPQPTATPGVVTTEIERLFSQPEATNNLRFDTADFVNLLISVLIVVVSYVLATWLIYSVLGRIVQRSQHEVGDELYKAVRSNLRWLVVILALRPATNRLVFLSTGMKIILSDVYFVLILLIGTVIFWKLIAVLEQWYRDKSTVMGNEAQIGPVISWLVRLANVVVIMTAIIILLSHFGVDVFAFAAALGLTGFAISLAARDTIADVIAGMTIMIDQPFRVGDRIEIQDENTWGDVTDIGLRTTRIRTRDNRLVIVPNSIIGKNQIINYTFPDPRYRVQTHLSIAYGTEIDTVRRIIIDTVRQVEGVLDDKPVDALYIEMANTAMIFRARWWIASYEDTRRIFDKVHTALQEAMDAVGLEIPNDAFDVNLKMDRQDDKILVDED